MMIAKPPKLGTFTVFTSPFGAVQLNTFRSPVGVSSIPEGVLLNGRVPTASLTFTNQYMNPARKKPIPKQRVTIIPAKTFSPVGMLSSCNRSWNAAMVIAGARKSQVIHSIFGNLSTPAT
eukprot:TRINITY_DN116446_c0_g1_i1.p2 TRINITY_DN116446_c0_g1~~TRINITY_DN116446_c0_g1_i1.p2  ORF type:complete len:120 (-),score=12.27 TRINITY_DN116446_c0_g1_i1:17-376(-)